MPRKIRCTVESITDHGGRVYTVDLAPANPVPSFRPGQFLHLTVDDYDPSGFWPESRVFSIASSPRDRMRLRICYSVKARYTTRMEQTLRVGGEVWIKMPYGDFVIDETNDAVLVAGGTGISAFTAFIQALKPNHPRMVTLIYGVRNPSLLLFQDMLLAQAERVPQFRVIYFAEELREPINGGTWHAGRISLGAVFRAVTSETHSPVARFPTSAAFYLSGPPVMLTALGTDLRARGVAPEDIRTDAWE
jgi:ferredoxin-NADP reductase